MTMTEVRHPLIRHKVGLLRAASLSTKSFREITAELGRLLAYEATADFPLEPVTVEGWAGPVQVERISGKKVTLVPILRAGLGMLDGVLDAIPNAKVSVVGIARNHVTLMPEPYVDRLAGELRRAHRDRPRPDARDRRLDDLGGVAAEVARRDRHPGAGAGGGAGRHRRARAGASRRARAGPRRSTATSTRTATSCPGWGTPGTASSGRGRPHPPRGVRPQAVHAR